MSASFQSRPPTNGSLIGQRKASISSFPSSRALSNHSYANGLSQLPIRSRTRRGDSPNSVRSSSTRSSANHGGQNTRQSRKLRSQYPLDSYETHVEYILVASFDVDRGPIMEYQYPGAISGDEGMLAELMLPDQTHVRSQDWTIFFLHKDIADEQEAREEARAERRRRKEDRLRAREDAKAMDNDGEPIPGEELEDRTDSEEEEEAREVEAAGEGPPLIYVLNLVNTKQDATAKRGARVKAMAICTRHPFLHIYKPLLLLALEDYFKSPVEATLEALYDSVNAMDLSLIPRLTIFERSILQASDIKDLFIEKFEKMIQQRIVEDAAATDPNNEDPASRLNGGRYLLPRDTHEYESRVTYNAIPIPIKVPTALSPETVGDFSIIKLITTFATPHTTQAQPFALHPHLTSAGAYTHPIIVLVNAILTEKRVIFLGHNRPSGEVAEAVLAACALVSGSVLRGFTRHAFPYTDLSKIDALLNVPGFIAGVTNPTFANHPEWWDLLCDIPTGRMKISNRIDPATSTQGLLSYQQQHPAYAPSNAGILPGPGLNSSDPRLADPAGDVAFMEDMSRSIAARQSEAAVRSKWRDYMIRFTRIAAVFEETVYGASALFIGASENDAGAFGVSGHGYVWADDVTRGREIGANVWRIEGWRNTRSYYAYIQDLAASWERRPIRDIDLDHQLDRLRILKLSREEAGKIYIALDQAIVSYDDLCQLLAAMPENHAGLFYITLGLFHSERDVREASARLLQRVREHEAGRHFWANQWRFAKKAFSRIAKEMEVREEVEEEEVLESLGIDFHR